MGTKKEDKPVAGIAGFMQAALVAAQKEFGERGSYVGAEHEKRHIGIPIPCLALQWLLHSTIYPLQKLTLSAGPPQTCKSTFTFELQKWFLASGGGVINVDAESKTSPFLRRSMIPDIFFTDPEQVIRYQHLSVGDIEGWQRAISLQLDSMESYLATFKAKPDFPLLITVDSMTAVQTETDNASVFKEGAAPGRAYSESPIMISQYLKTISDRILGWPVCIHFVNHEKTNMDGEGSHTPGGSSKDFHASIDMRFSLSTGDKTGCYLGKTPIIEILSEGLQGRHIRIKTFKNSFGPSKREIHVPFLWKFVDDPTAPQGWKQVSWWEWEDATSRLLAENARDLTKAGVMDIGIIQSKSFKDENDKHVRNEVAYYSERMGIKEREAVMPRDFGKLVHSDTALMSELQKFFNIPVYPTFTAGCFDYADEIAAVGKEKKKDEGKKKPDWMAGGNA